MEPTKPENHSSKSDSSRLMMFLLLLTQLLVVFLIYRHHLMLQRVDQLTMSVNFLTSQKTSNSNQSVSGSASSDELRKVARSVTKIEGIARSIHHDTLKELDIKTRKIDKDLRELKLVVEGSMDRKDKQFYEYRDQARAEYLSATRRVHHIQNQIFQLQNSLKFYLPQHSVQEHLLSMKGSPVVSLVLSGDLASSKSLKLFHPKGERAKLFPPKKLLEERNYHLLSDGRDYFFFKGKGAQEYLGYLLTGILVPAARQVKSLYLRDRTIEGKTLRGTIQEFIMNLSSVEAANLHTLPRAHRMQLFRFLLADYILANNDRDFLFSASENKIVGVDTDASFNFSNDDWFKKGGFFKTLIQITHNDPYVREFIVKTQMEIQAVPDKLLIQAFDLVAEDDAWDSPQGVQASRDLVLARKKKLGDFVEEILVQLTVGG